MVITGYMDFLLKLVIYLPSFRTYTWPGPFSEYTASGDSVKECRREQKVVDLILVISNAECTSTSEFSCIKGWVFGKVFCRSSGE